MNSTSGVIQAVCDNTAVYSTSGVIQAVCSCHIVISSSFKSVYFWSFSVMALWRLWLLGIATYTECASLVVLSSISYYCHCYYYYCCCCCVETFPDLAAKCVHIQLHASTVCRLLTEMCCSLFQIRLQVSVTGRTVRKPLVIPCEAELGCRSLSASADSIRLSLLVLCLLQPVRIRYPSPWWAVFRTRTCDDALSAIRTHDSTSSGPTQYVP